MNIQETIKSQKMSLPTQTVINIMYTSRIIEESIIAILKEYDLTLQQYNVLRILRGQKGNPANLSTVQERMIDKNSNTTRLVDKLIKKNLVKRQVCKNNRRKIELFITENGLSYLKTLDPITEQNNKVLLQQLSKKNLDELNELLDTIRS